MRLSLLSLLSAGVALLLGACSTDKCENSPNALYTSTGFLLLTPVGNQSLFTPGGDYFRDSVRVFDERGQRVDLFAPRADLSIPDITFLLLEPGKAPVLNTPVTRQFILYLRKTDQDTVRAEYELFKNKCDNADVKSLRLFYNNVKVYEGTTPYVSDVLVRKR